MADNVESSGKTTEIVNRAIEFMTECESYLHSWLCTQSGEYRPYDYQAVHRVLLMLVATGSTHPIEDFKKTFKEGKLLIGAHAFAFSNDMKKKLYEKHKKNVKEFEKKYNLKDGED